MKPPVNEIVGKRKHISQEPSPSHNPYVGNLKQETAVFLSTDDRYTTARAVKHTARTVQKAVVT
jgi:hypothetical protein